MVKEFFERNGDYFYFAFRIIIGILFFLHGVQKASGIASGNMALLSLIGLAGVIELLVGLFLVLGLLTRYVTIVGAVTMLVAYFKVHAAGGLNPLVNKGELALVYFAAFLALMAFGARKWGLDTLKKK